MTQDLATIQAVGLQEKGEGELEIGRVAVDVALFAIWNHGQRASPATKSGSALKDDGRFYRISKLPRRDFELARRQRIP